MHWSIRTPRMWHLPPAADEQEAAKQMSEMQFLKLDELNYIIICHSPDNIKYICSSASQEMCDNLYGIGWFQEDSTAYKNHQNKIAELEAQQAARNVLIEKNELKFLDTTAQAEIKQKLIKKDKYIECYANKIKKIEAENSLRSRILRLLKNGSIYAF